jgi:tRNA A58 N-methylase Trm61
LSNENELRNGFETGGLISNEDMGIITGYLGCTPEAAIIEYGIGTLLFCGWFFSMWLLSYHYNEETSI